MLSLQKKHSKLKDLTYKEHKMKPYLRDSETTLEEKITLFKWRTRMENFSNNFKRGRENLAPCVLCGLHDDNQKEIFNCPQVVEKIDAEDNYQSLFNDTIEKLVAKKVTKISELRSTRDE